MGVRFVKFSVTKLDFLQVQVFPDCFLVQLMPKKGGVIMMMIWWITFNDKN